MARLYFVKIKNKEENFMTGELWKIEDVPTLWRRQVQDMLDEDQNREY